MTNVSASGASSETTISNSSKIVTIGSTCSGVSKSSGRRSLISE